MARIGIRPNVDIIIKSLKDGSLFHKEILLGVTGLEMDNEDRLLSYSKGRFTKKFKDELRNSSNANCSDYYDFVKKLAIGKQHKKCNDIVNFFQI